jgi:release factor glutamine methyltransferase
LRLAEEITKSSTPNSTNSTPLQLLDLCSGSGCIPLLLAHELRNQLDRAVGVDISSKAIRLATENAECLEMTNVRFFQNDIMRKNALCEIQAATHSKVAILTANPPYISQADWEALPNSVKRYEDSRALLGDLEGQSGRGLAFYHRIAELLPSLLLGEEEMGNDGWRGSPRVMLEIGETQGQEVVKIVAQAGEGMFTRTEIWKDQSGKDRAVVGWT